MSDLRVLAAGSLRVVWPRLMSAYMRQSNQTVTTVFGPAGLLLQRIEQGEPCDFFASANVAHPQTLFASGRAVTTGIFARNQLCLSLRPELAKEKPLWLDLLLDAGLRVATSTPLSDPSGDYTWQLFDRLEASHPGEGEALKRRALQLVGGPKSPAVPSGEYAASWLLNSGQADLFIGYRSYAPLLAAEGKVITLAIPSPWQIQADYAFAVCKERAGSLGAFLLAEEAQDILREAGFSG